MGTATLTTHQLTEVESFELEHLEQRIEKAVRTIEANWRDLAQCLATIRDKKLYRASHNTFDEYCREKHSKSSQRINQLIQGDQVITNLTTRVVKPPETEYQARPLTTLPAVEQAEAWKAAQEEAGTDQPPASVVKRVVKERKEKIDYVDPTWAVGDRVIDTFSKKEGTVVEITPAVTRIVRDNGNESLLGHCYIKPVRIAVKDLAPQMPPWNLGEVVCVQHDQQKYSAEVLRITPTMTQLRDGDGCTFCIGNQFITQHTLFEIGDWVRSVKDKNPVEGAIAHLGNRTARLHDGTAIELAHAVKIPPPEDPTQEHYTPDHIVEAVLQVLGTIELDPCSNLGLPNVKAEQHYTRLDDGLKQDWAWAERIYCNPPYTPNGTMGHWADKLNEWRVADGGLAPDQAAIVLVPAYTDTAWWQTLTTGATVCLIKGRLTFKGNQDPARFPSAIVLLANQDCWFHDRFCEVFGKLGRIWRELA